MDIKTTRKHSVFDRLGGQPVRNRVCTYWLAGRCNRNPCRFMHTESPPSQTEKSQSVGPDDICRKQSRKMTWRNPNYYTSKTDTISSNEGAMSKNTSDESTPQKVLAIPSTMSDTSGKAQSKISTAIQVEHEETSVRKVQPKQCKYWVTDNCVHGDKCKDTHSWFCGSGFTLLTKLEGHTKAITGISLPSGGDKLYTCGNDRSIRAWDCNSGQCVDSVTMDGEVGCSITKGPWLFVGLCNAVKVWNLQNQAEFTLNGPVGLVCSMAMNNDKLFAGVEDGSILVWEWRSETNMFEPTAMLKEHNGAVRSLVVGAKRLFSASTDCTIKVWDLQNLQCFQTLYGHTKEVTSVLCWDHFLLSASLDNTLKVWGTTESGSIDVFYGIKEDCGMIALHGIYDAEAQPILLCSCNDNTVRLYDLPTFFERGRIFSKREVQVIENGIEGLFFTGDATGEIFVWKLLGFPCAISS